MSPTDERKHIEAHEQDARSSSRPQSWGEISGAVIGKVSFESKKLEENFAAMVKSIGKDKVKSIFIKPTMGPSVKLTV